MSSMAGGGTRPMYSNRRPFHEMLLLCAGQAVHDFITDMSPEAMDDQIKNDLITGYSDLQGLGCKQSAYDSITQ